MTCDMTQSEEQQGSNSEPKTSQMFRNIERNQDPALGLSWAYTAPCWRGSTWSSCTSETSLQVVLKRILLTLSSKHGYSMDGYMNWLKNKMQKVGLFRWMCHWKTKKWIHKILQWAICSCLYHSPVFYAGYLYSAAELHYCHIFHLYQIISF